MAATPSPIAVVDTMAVPPPPAAPSIIATTGLAVAPGPAANQPEYYEGPYAFLELVMLYKVLSFYSASIKSSDLLTVEPVDCHSECPFPPVLMAKERLTQYYLDLCGRSSRSFFKQLFLFATSLQARNILRALFERKGATSNQEEPASYTARLRAKSFDRERTNQEEFERYTATHTYWIGDAVLFRCRHWRDKLAVQVRTGILQPPANTETPIVCFGLGTGVAPFCGFMQRRQRLLEQGAKLGPATLYVGYRHESLDYYLKEDFQEWIKRGVLSNLHPAFPTTIERREVGSYTSFWILLAKSQKDMAKALLLEEKTTTKCMYSIVGEFQASLRPSNVRWRMQSNTNTG